MNSPLPDYRSFVLKADLNLEISTKRLEKLSSDDAIFKIVFTSICGSDIRISKYGDSRIIGDRVLGHEIVAKVEIGRAHV